MNFIYQHSIGFAIAGAYVFVAAVTAMNPQWDGFYNWLYRFTHALLPLAENWLTRKRANGNASSSNGNSATMTAPFVSGNLTLPAK